MDAKTSSRSLDWATFTVRILVALLALTVPVGANAQSVDHSLFAINSLTKLESADASTEANIPSPYVYEIGQLPQRLAEDFERFTTQSYFFQHHSIGVEIGSLSPTISHEDFNASGIGGLDFRLSRTYSSGIAYTTSIGTVALEQRKKMVEYLSQVLDSVALATKKHIADQYRPELARLARDVYGRNIDFSQGFNDPAALYQTIMEYDWPIFERNGNIFFEYLIDEAGDIIWPYFECEEPNSVNGYCYRSAPLKATSCSPDEGCEFSLPVGSVRHEPAVLFLATSMRQLHDEAMSHIEYLRNMANEQVREINAEIGNPNWKIYQLAEGWVFNIPSIRPPISPRAPSVGVTGVNQGHPGSEGFVYFDGYRKQSFGHLTYKEFPTEKAILKEIDSDDKRLLAQRRGEYEITREARVDPETGAPIMVEVEHFGSAESLRYRLSQNERYFFFSEDGRLIYEADYSLTNFITYRYEAHDSFKPQLKQIEDTRGNTYDFQYLYRDAPASSGYGYPTRITRITSRDRLGQSYKTVEYHSRGNSPVIETESATRAAFDAQKSVILTAVRDGEAGNSDLEFGSADQSVYETKYEYEQKRLFYGYINFEGTYFDINLLSKETNPLGGETRFQYNTPNYQKLDVPLMAGRSLFSDDPNTPTALWISEPTTASRIYRDGQVSAAYLLDDSRPNERHIIEALPDRIVENYLLFAASADRWLIKRRTVHATSWDDSQYVDFASSAFDQSSLDEHRGEIFEQLRYEYYAGGNQNIRRITESGIVSLITEYFYDDGSPQKVLYGLPSSVFVRDSNNREYRSVEYTFDPVFHERLIGIAGDTRRLSFQYRHSPTQNPMGCVKPTRRTEISTDSGRRYHTHLWYDDHCNLIKTQNPSGQITAFEYSEEVADDGRAQSKRVESRLIDDRSIERYVVFDAFGKVTVATDATGAETRIAYDRLGRMISSHFPDGGTTEYEYGDPSDANDQGNVTLIDLLVRPLPDDVHYQYALESDPWGRLKNWRRSVVVSDGSSTPQEPDSVVAMEYDLLGRPRKITSNADAIINYEYDPLDRVTKVGDARGGVTSLTYDDRMMMRAVKYRLYQAGLQNAYATARTVEVTGPTGETERVFFDTVGRMIFREIPFKSDFGTTDEVAVWRYGWDKRGRLRYLTNPLGAQTEWTFDSLDRAVRVSAADGIERMEASCNEFNDLHQCLVFEDAEGNTTGFQYDAFNRLSVIMRPEKHLTRLTYDDNGRLQHKDENGAVTSYAYDPMGRLKSRTDAQRNTDVYAYDLLGRRIISKNPYGPWREWQYNADGKVIGFKDEEGRQYRWRYGSSGGLSRSWLPNGAATTRQYGTNKAGDVTSLRDLRGNVWRYSRDLAGRVSNVTNIRLGTSKTIKYNGFGEIESITMPDGATWRYDYNALGQRRAVRTPEGRVAEIEHDAFGRVTAELRGGSVFRAFAYNRNGNVRRVGNQAGPLSEFRYDGLDRIEEILPYGNPGIEEHAAELASRPAIKFEYLEAGSEVRVTGIEGEVFELGRSNLGEVERITDSEGITTYLRRDKVGRLDRIAIFQEGTISDPETANPAELRSQGVYYKDYAFTPSGRVSQIFHADGSVVELGYDINGYLDRVVDEEGLTTSILNDPLYGWPLRIAGPDGIIRRVSRDNIGRIKYTDFSSTPEKFEYDDLNRTITVLQASGRKHVYGFGPDGYLAEIKAPDNATPLTTFGYDAMGNLLWVRDPNGDLTKYSRDEFGRYLSTEVNGEDVGESFIYNIDGSRHTVDTADGKVRYSYNESGRLKTVEYPDGFTVTYGYYANGRLKQIADDSGITKTFEYDPLGRVTRVSVGGNSVHLERDSRGRVQGEIHEPSNRRYWAKYARNRTLRLIQNVEYVYDHDTGVLSAIQILTGDDRLLFRLDYEYYQNGWVKIISGPEGFFSEFEYDPDGRLQALQNNTERFEFQYDRNGNPWVVTRTVGDEQQQDEYLYDHAGRLRFVNQGTARELEYRYDARGNLTYERDVEQGTVLHREFDQFNRLMVIRDDGGQELARFTYDARGNLSEILYGDARTDTIEWDRIHRLVGITSRRPGVGAPTRLAEFQYDPLDRLVSYQNTAAGTVQSFNYIGPLTIGVSVDDGEPKIVVPDPANLRPIALFGGDGTAIPTWILGSAVSSHDQSGTELETIDRRPYGDHSNANIDINPLGFKGYAQLSQSGMYWAGTRFYNGELKQFLSTDILAGDPFGPRTMNRRNVFLANPVRFVDFFGLQNVDEAGNRIVFDPVTICVGCDGVKGKPHPNPLFGDPLSFPDLPVLTDMPRLQLPGLDISDIPSFPSDLIEFDWIGFGSGWDPEVDVDWTEFAVGWDPEVSFDWTAFGSDWEPDVEVDWQEFAADWDPEVEIDWEEFGAGWEFYFSDFWGNYFSTFDGEEVVSIDWTLETEEEENVIDVYLKPRVDDALFGMELRAGIYTPWGFELGLSDTLRLRLGVGKPGMSVKAGPAPSRGSKVRMRAAASARRLLLEGGVSGHLGREYDYKTRIWKPENGLHPFARLNSGNLKPLGQKPPTWSLEGFSGSAGFELIVDPYDLYHAGRLQWGMQEWGEYLFR